MAKRDVDRPRRDQPGSEPGLRINGSGQAVGESELAGARHAVLWAADGTVTDLGGDLRDAARRLNDAGQVLLAVPGGGARWQNGQRTSLGDVSLPTDLNEAGLVVGIGPGTADNDFPFRWNDGVTTVIDLLPPVGNRQAVNLDVNERGQVIGRQCAASAGCRGGALSSFWENGVTTAIPTLGGSRSDVVASTEPSTTTTQPGTTTTTQPTTTTTRPEDGPVYSCGGVSGNGARTPATAARAGTRLGAARRSPPSPEPSPTTRPTPWPGRTRRRAWAR